MSSASQVEANDPAAFEARLAEQAREALAANTRRGYASDWRDFTIWCMGHGVDPLPATPTTLKRYFTDRQAKLSKATLTPAHRLDQPGPQIRRVGSPTLDPSFRMVMSGIRRIKKQDEPAAKQALLVEDLIEILEQIPDDTRRAAASRSASRGAGSRRPVR